MTSDIDVIGADLAREAGAPCVFWVLDGTPGSVRRGLRAAGWPGHDRRGRLRVVEPRLGSRPERRGPSVALLVEDTVLAADHLAQLLPVTVVPVWFGGAHTSGPVRMRVGGPLLPEPGEPAGRFTDRVADAADDLAREEGSGWWQVARERAVSVAAPPVPDTSGARPPVVPAGGWRQRWQRTEPPPEPHGIWPLR